MTNENKAEETVVAKPVWYHFPVPSKGKYEPYTTTRFSYDVTNVEDLTPIEVKGVSFNPLRAKVQFRVFKEDYVGGKNGPTLDEFDALTPGLDLTTRELVHGIYTNEEGKALRIIIKGRGEMGVPAYICDPSRKDGHNEFYENFPMYELRNATLGGDRPDHFKRNNGKPVRSERVAKSVKNTGDVKDLKAAGGVSYAGWVFSQPPSSPDEDVDAGTATFKSANDLGYAVYVSTSMLNFVVNVYVSRAKVWREVIEGEHPIHQAKARVHTRRFENPATRKQKPKPKAVKPTVVETPPETGNSDESATPVAVPPEA